MDIDIYDIIDNIYKLPLASKEALLNKATEVTYPKGFHLFLANRKSSKFYLMKKGMLHAYTYKSDKKVTFWFGKEGDAIFPLQTLYNNQAGYENIELLEDSVLYELSVDKLHDLYLAEEPSTAEQIASREKIDRRTVYKDIDACLSDLSVLFFGIDGLDQAFP